MIIVLKSGSSDADLADVERRIRAMGYTPHTIRGELRTVIGAVGDDRGKERLRALESLECVEAVTPILQPFKLASREVRSANTQVRVGDTVIGGRTIVVMAGPCSVESRQQVLDVADAREGGRRPRAARRRLQAAHLALRVPGPRGRRASSSSPRPRETGLPVITEVMEPERVDLVAEHADILQIGARNMQNFSLLRRVAEAGKPVLLKRGMSATIEEWLLSAEYVLSRRQPQRHPVRARHPHLRDRHALHARPERGAGAEEALAPAGRRRSQPRHRALGVRRVDGPGGGGGRRRRPDHRGASEAGGGAVGRAAVAQAGPLRRADAARLRKVAEAVDRDL